MRAGSLCAADLPVCLPLGGSVVGVAMEMPARAWADRLGIQWDTVRQRRYRGDPWSMAFQPCLRRTPFNNEGAKPVLPGQKKQTISGDIQMSKLQLTVPSVGKLQVAVPPVAHVVVVGVPDDVKVAVMTRFQQVLRDEFGATAQADMPESAATPTTDASKSLWVLSHA